MKAWTTSLLSHVRSARVLIQHMLEVLQDFPHGPGMHASQVHHLAQAIHQPAVRLDFELVADPGLRAQRLQPPLPKPSMKPPP
jgi:hypothetical protein